MIRKTVKPALIGVASLLMILGAGSASADYRITAFGDAIAYRALLTRDAEAAISALGSRNSAILKFDEINNLCVAYILDANYSAAIASCERALLKLERELKLTMNAEKSAKASIYSNMAVAKALAGDLTGASEDLQQALSFNGRDRNALENLELISAKRAPGAIAGNL